MSSRDLNLPITAEDFTKPATDGAARNFDRLQTKVNKFNTSKPSAEMEALAGIVAKNGKDGETAFAAVQRSIDETKNHVTSLKKEFAGSGSASVFGDLKGAEKDLKTLEGLLGDMGGLVEKDGEKTGESFLSGITSAFSDTPIVPALVAYLAPAIAAAAGAAIAAGLTTGIGFGFIAVGALVLKKNKELAADFGHLKTDVAAELAGAASPLIAPFDAALNRIDALIKAEQPQFGAIFSAVAPAVTSVEQIIESFVATIVPKLAPIGTIFSEAFNDPSTAREIRVVENQVGSLFTLIAQNGQVIDDTFTVGAYAVSGLVTVMNVLIRAAGLADTAFHSTGIPTFIGWLNNIADGGHRSAQSMNEFGPAAQALTGVVDGLNLVGSTAPLTDKQLQALSQTISSTATTADTLAGAMTDRLLGSMLSNDQASLHFAESLTAVRAALKQNKDALDIHKAAGQADREAVLSAVQANVQQYDAMIASGLSAESAAHKYDTNTAALRRQLSAAGLTGKQIDGLIGKYDNVPDDVNTNVAIKGLTAAINDLAALERQIHGIPDTKNVTVGVHVSRSQLAKVNAELSRFQGSAAAGAAWMPAGMSARADGSSDATQPAREVSVTSTLNARFEIDGQVIDRRVYRINAQRQHARRVGTR